MRKFLALLSVVAVLNFFIPTSAYAVGIARDNSAAYNTGGTPGTVTVSNYVVGAGSNMIMLVGARCSGANNITGVTFNGVSLTQLYTITDITAAGNVRVFAMLAPAGTHNVVISGASCGRIEGAVVTYSGVNQSLTLDSNNSIDDPNLSGNHSTFPVNTTVVASGSWLVSFLAFGDLVNSITNQTFVQNNDTGSCGSTAGATVFSDSNTTVSTGVNTITGNLCSNTGSALGFVFSLAPVATAGASFNFWQFFDF